MPTETPTENATDGTPVAELGATEIFPLLAHDRRRYVLHYLSQQVGAVSMNDLAEQIAIWEDDPTTDRYERVLTSLYHAHLPKLAEGGLITYDLERERVSPLEPINGVSAYLGLAVQDDILP